MLFYTKTFIRRVWFREAATGWTPLRTPEDTPELDAQVRTWVDATGATITHPGQLGVHHVRFDPDLLCMTFGLTVLYQPPVTSDASPEPTTADPVLQYRPADANSGGESGGLGTTADPN